MPRSKVMMNVKQGFQASVENVNVLLPVINPIVMYLQVESDTKNFFYRRDVLWTYEDKLFQGDVASVQTAFKSNSDGLLALIWLALPKFTQSIKQLGKLLLVSWYDPSQMHISHVVQCWSWFCLCLNQTYIQTLGRMKMKIECPLLQFSWGRKGKQKVVATVLICFAIWHKWMMLHDGMAQPSLLVTFITKHPSAA